MQQLAYTVFLSYAKDNISLDKKIFRFKILRFKKKMRLRIAGNKELRIKNSIIFLLNNANTCFKSGL